jgi:putative endonuclease
MVFKVYILYALKHDKLFTGMTASLIDRMSSHNGDDADDWTSAYKPWILVHMELFDDEAEALLREQYFESQEGQEHVRTDVLPLFDL